MPKSIQLVPLETVSFNGNPITLHSGNGEIWVEGAEIGRALGYSDPGAGIRNILSQHRDELDLFLVSYGIDTKPQTDAKPQGGRPATFYSEPGVYLLAMFARTERAAAFRLWVAETLTALRRGAFVPRAKYEAALKRAAVVELREFKKRFEMSDRDVSKAVKYRNSGVSRRDLCRIFGFGDATLGKLLHILSDMGKVEVAAMPEQLRLEACNEPR